MPSVLLQCPLGVWYGLLSLLGCSLRRCGSVVAAALQRYSVNPGVAILPQESPPVDTRQPTLACSTTYKRKRGSCCEAAARLAVPVSQRLADPVREPPLPVLLREHRGPHGRNAEEQRLRQLTQRAAENMYLQHEMRSGICRDSMYMYGPRRFLRKSFFCPSSPGLRGHSGTTFIFSRSQRRRKTPLPPIRRILRPATRRGRPTPPVLHRSRGEIVLCIVDLGEEGVVVVGVESATGADTSLPS